MTTLNGNTHRRDGPRDERLPAVPDLIYPNLRFQDDDYAHLQARLDLYNDLIILTKFMAGEMTQQYAVDPAEVAAALAGLELSSGLLPERCLFWSKKEGADRLGVYLPPRVWTVTIRDEKPAWRVPLPGLVFAGHEYNYSLWAVKEPPLNRNVPLYMAPSPNVHPEGVCLGNAPFPRAGTTTIWQAVETFFSSKFNRDLSNAKSQAYPDCVLGQWQALWQAGAESYPLDDLVETRFTVGRLIDDKLGF
jgi:hypothetical protein